MLTGDVRYQLHLLLYQRVHAIWLLLTSVLCLLLPLALANLELLAVGGACLLWLCLQAVGLFVSAKLRHKVSILAGAEQIAA